MSILSKNLIATFDNGEQWSIPVRAIAVNHAEYCATADDMSVEEALERETIPLFEEDETEIYDWAVNNMNWESVVGEAQQLRGPNPALYQWMWSSCDWEVR